MWSLSRRTQRSAKTKANSSLESARDSCSAAVEAGAGGEELLRQVGRVAEQHGISDWEAEPLAYRAMGEGLSMSGMDASEAHAFAREIAGDDAGIFRALVEGYEA